MGLLSKTHTKRKQQKGTKITEWKAYYYKLQNKSPHINAKRKVNNKKWRKNVDLYIIDQGGCEGFSRILRDDRESKMCLWKRIYSYAS
jgi:hypothetical protein